MAKASGDPLAFEWFEVPPVHAAEAALSLLARLAAIDERRRLTAVGEQLRQLAVHPRLGRVLLETRAAWRAAAACALLSERLPPRSGDAVTALDCDLFPLIERMPPGQRAAARELQSQARRALGAEAPTAEESDEGLRRGLFLGYADRLARRRQPRQPRLLLASGHGAQLGRESGVIEAEFLVALDVTGFERAGVSEALVRLASAVDPGWIEPTAVERVHEYDAAARQVRAFERERASRPWSCGSGRWRPIRPRARACWRPSCAGKGWGRRRSKCSAAYASPASSSTSTR